MEIRFKKKPSSNFVPMPQSAAKQGNVTLQTAPNKQNNTKPQIPVTKQATTPQSSFTKRSKKLRLKVSGATATSKAQRETRDQSMGQARKGLIFIGIATIVYALYLVFSGQMDEFLTAMAGVRRRWVVAAMLAYVVYFFWGVLAYLLAVISDRKSRIGIRDLMSVEASGIFFPTLRQTVLVARQHRFTASLVQDFLRVERAQCSIPASSCMKREKAFLPH